jgi:hypothetical protein
MIDFVWHNHAHVRALIADLELCDFTNHHAHAKAVIPAFGIICVRKKILAHVTNPSDSDAQSAPSYIQGRLHGARFR